jgi:uncharacterized protein involved in outer membrane biogenesis
MIVAAAGLGAVLVVLAASLAAAHHLKSIIVHAVTARTGRAVSIDGELTVDLLRRHPWAAAQSVTVGNPLWMDAGTTATAGRVNVLFDWRLALPPLAIDRLEIGQAELNLERDAAGRANWHLREEGARSGPPLMRSLSIPDAHVRLHDLRRNFDFAGVVSADDTGADELPGPLRIVGHGQFNGRPMSFNITGDPLEQARRARPYRFEFEERSGTAHLNGRGELARAFDLRELQGTFAARGQDLRDLYYLVGLRYPETGPFELTGKLVRHARDYSYSELHLKSGDSDLTGTVHVTTPPPGGRTRFAAELQSTRLRLADLGPRTHAAPGESDPEESGLRVPSTPWRTTWLRTSDAQVQLHALEFDLGRVTFTEASARFALERGELAIDDIRAGVLGGRLAGQARLDARGELPQGSADLTLTDARLGTSGSAATGALAGSLSGRAQLHGRGDSWHAMAASADGTLTLVMPEGEVRAALAEAASLELAGALGLAARSQKETPVRCAVLSLDAKDGTFAAHSMVLDTDQALITGSGALHMDDESLDFTLHGHPKRPALVLRSGVAVRGALLHPQFGLKGSGLAAQSGVAVALGVVLTPLASILAFVSPGLAHDAHCQQLLAQYQPAAQAPAH